ncbi:MAG TPA: ribokinase [Thermomicrobiales bacterium]|nr:ribokinase [Thermomicrobiales bacterium]
MAKRADIVVAGAINTDLVAVVDRAPGAGETVTGLSFALFGGGKAANQAVAARRAGATVALVGAVGDDAFGSARTIELEADGIDIDGVVQMADMASGVALITVEREGENRIAYVPGPTLRITGVQIREVLDSARPVVYLQPNEVVSEAAIEALRQAKRLGSMTVLNATPDPLAVRPMLEHVDVLVVNEGEAVALLGRGGARPEVAAELAESTGTTVVLTAGREGAYGVHESKLFHVPAPSVKVVDTTGAGDTFCGAFAAQIAHGQSFERSVRWAVCAASIAATKAGAQPSIPWAEEVDVAIGSQV